jgi:N-acyl-L-homoserine lactone synthetase
VAQDAAGEIAGCGRLLPTTRPYLLGDVFPQLLNGAPPPASPEVWELSRFCAVDLNARLSGPLSQMVSPVAVEIVRAALRCVAELGAKRLITVSPVGIERLIRRAGLRSHRAGPPMVIDGHAIFACLIDVEDN